ncbi:uncharacterized protein [Aegilops tauschii subsp. strangulata]|uniref:uncharacterized protein n=1 Tax=Aegilops tauschii subsp. strangulata TaxID=200361 RepID=UPI001ABD1A3F|nr:uncharacterized protein LOC120972723 [Aegilops tauschii subsp. strangulata]
MLLPEAPTVITLTFPYRSLSPLLSPHSHRRRRRRAADRRTASRPPATFTGIRNSTLAIAIDTDNKGKEVVPSKEQDKGKDEVPPSEVTPVQVTPVQSPGMDDDVPEVPTTGKHRNYGHYHEVGGSTTFCMVILAPQLEAIPMPLDFTRHFPSVPQEFKLKTNIGCF